jgi:hypothetical protein
MKAESGEVVMSLRAGLGVVDDSSLGEWAFDMESEDLTGGDHFGVEESPLAEPYWTQLAGRT